jgi:hypothetical protein
MDEFDHSLPQYLVGNGEIELVSIANRRRRPHHRSQGKFARL